MQFTGLHSLRFRLIASVVAIEVIMLSLLVWSNMGIIRAAHADRLRDTASSMLQQIATTSGGYLVEVDYATLGEYLSNLATHSELAYLAVMDRDERPVFSLGQLPVSRWPVQDDHPLQVDDGVLDVGAEIRIGERIMGQVRMGFSLALMERAIHAAKVRNIVIAVTAITLTILVTVLIGLHLTRRLATLANAAQRVGAGDYSVAVPAEVEDEVGMTAMAFNQMVSEISVRTKRLQEALAKERVIEKTSIDGMITYGKDLRILSVNPAMTPLFGYTETELLGEPVSLLLNQHSTEADTTSEYNGGWTNVSGVRDEVLGTRKDGSEFPLELYIGRVEIGGVPLYAATLHDITERKRSERECRTLLEGNRYLIHKSLAVQEEERRHLARELHDELGQCMTAIQADAETIYDLSKGRDTKIETSAGAILNVSSRIYDVVHSMMERLRPGVLDDLGLVAAIDEELAAWQSRHPKIRCEFTTGGDLSQLGEATNITLYRIVQESLTNISKHAQASRVVIELSVQEAQDGSPVVRLKVQDNGRGMGPTPPRRGLGLIGMRERVEALNGTFRIEAVPEGGLGIEVSVPMPGSETVPVLNAL